MVLVLGAKVLILIGWALIIAAYHSYSPQFLQRDSPSELGKDDNVPYFVVLSRLFLNLLTRKSQAPGRMTFYCPPLFPSLYSIIAHRTPLSSTVLCRTPMSLSSPGLSRHLSLFSEVFHCFPLSPAILYCPLLSLAILCSYLLSLAEDVSGHRACRPC